MAEIHLVSRAIQYYAAGRFSALAQQFPVCANLLHHAVEMIIKGALARKLSRDEIVGLGHNLKRAWRSYQSHYADPRLPALDSSVDRLHKFEKLRYPDDVLVSGMRGTFALTRSDAAAIGGGGGRHVNVPRYDLVLEDVDELMLLVFSTTPMNPSFYAGGLSSQAAKTLREKNLHPIFAAA